jgi:hypothetical protein
LSKKRREGGREGKVKGNKLHLTSKN